VKNKKLCLYIHIPFCISKCDYCDFFSLVSQPEGEKKVPDSYVDALCNEIAYRIKQYQPDLLKSIYIGGGTPSLLEEKQLNKICRRIFSALEALNIDNSSSDAFEFSIEVNPDDLSKELLEGLEKNGINRLSCGIQSCNDYCLNCVKRRAKRKENLRALELINKYWKKKKSFDLICGLPGESQESFKEGLDIILAEKPEHISMYSLTIEDNTPLGQKYNSGLIAYDFNSADDLWLKAKEYLEKNAYEQYEVSNFCRKGNECIHNLVYWNHEDYIGCGCGATGTLYNPDGSGSRLTVTKDVAAYIDFWTDSYNKEKSSSFDYFFEKNKGRIYIEENIDLEASVFEYFMMGLRKLSGISDLDFYSKFKRAFPSNVIKLFEKWQEKGLAQISKKGAVTNYRLNKKGILFLNRFLEEIN